MLTEEEVGGTPGETFGIAGGILGEDGRSRGFVGGGLGTGTVPGAVLGTALEGEPLEGGAAGLIEVAAELGVFEDEVVVLALEAADAVLGFQKKVADGAGFEVAEGALDLHEFVHEGGGFHGVAPGEKDGDRVPWIGRSGCDGCHSGGWAIYFGYGEAGERKRKGA